MGRERGDDNAVANRPITMTDAPKVDPAIEWACGGSPSRGVVTIDTSPVEFERSGNALR